MEPEHSVIKGLPCIRQKIKIFSYLPTLNFFGMLAETQVIFLGLRNATVTSQRAAEHVKSQAHTEMFFFLLLVFFP